MSFLARMFAVGRVSAVCSLALLLLAAPICGTRCQAQFCDAPQAGTQKSACHEGSGGVIGASIYGQVHAQRNCGARELPCALPANPRNGPRDSMALAKSERISILPVIVLPHWSRTDLAFLTVSALARSNSPEWHSAWSASPVLRI